MRTRDLKPAFFRDETLLDLPLAARLLFAGLWCMADRRGRLKDQPKIIKADVFPADNIRVDKLLAVLAEVGLIDRYEVDGSRLIWIPNFLRHQHPHPNEQESVLPKSPSEGVPKSSLEEHQGTSSDAPRYSPNPSHTLSPLVPLSPLATQPSSDLATALAPGEVARSLQREAWENRIGILAPADLREFAEYEEAVPEQWFLDAIEITIEKADRPSWAFCRRVLQRCLETQEAPRAKKGRTKAPSSVAEVLERKQASRARTEIAPGRTPAGRTGA